MTPLTTEQANAVWDVLIQHAGADEHGRDDFVRTQTAGPCDEYRFMGWLGFGGKFWKHSDRWTVTAYPEDWTPGRDAIIAHTDAALAALRTSSVALDKAVQGR